jgi:hypothetical protein
MSIGRVDLGVMATSTDVTAMRAAEEARPVADQHNFQAQFKEEVENNQHSVNAKNDIDTGHMNSDAQDKGSNEYLGDGGRHRRESHGGGQKETLERRVSVDKMEKMAETMHDRHGKPIDFQISKGFDLKI